MTAEACPKCGRPVGRAGGECAYAISRGLNRELCAENCDGYAAGRRVGIDEGVRLAKEHAGISFLSEADDACINWGRVNKAAAKAKGE